MLWASRSIDLNRAINISANAIKEKPSPSIAENKCWSEFTLRFLGVSQSAAFQLLNTLFKFVSNRFSIHEFQDNQLSVMSYALETKIMETFCFFLTTALLLLDFTILRPTDESNPYQCFVFWQGIYTYDVCRDIKFSNVFYDNIFSLVLWVNLKGVPQSNLHMYKVYPMISYRQKWFLYSCNYLYF